MYFYAFLGLSMTFQNNKARCDRNAGAEKHSDSGYVTVQINWREPSESRRKTAPCNDSRSRPTTLDGGCKLHTLNSRYR